MTLQIFRAWEYSAQIGVEFEALKADRWVWGASNRRTRTRRRLKNLWVVTLAPKCIHFRVIAHLARSTRHELAVCSVKPFNLLLFSFCCHFRGQAIFRPAFLFSHSLLSS